MFGRSGAAVEFLADWQIGDALLRVIAQARQQLTLVSPYNKHWGASETRSSRRPAAGCGGDDLLPGG